jgi:hypothetical protein
MRISQSEASHKFDEEEVDFEMSIRSSDKESVIRQTYEKIKS